MSTEARFAAGEWYAVVGEHATVVLPVGERARVAGLWDLADSGASADALLDALLAHGLSSLEHFALVAHDDAAARLIVRGAPTATLSTAEGDEVVSAAPGAAWAERLATGATSIRVTLGGDAGVEHVLAPGVARVSVLEFGPPAAPEGSSVAPAVLVEEPVVEPEQPAAQHREPLAEAAPQAEPEPQFEPQSHPDPQPQPEQQLQPEPRSQPDPAPEPEPQPEPGPVLGQAPEPPAFVPEAAPVPDAPFAAVGVEPLQFGMPGEDDPTPTGETPAIDDDWSDRDGQTQIGAPAPEFDRPPIPGQEIAPEVVARPVAQLIFSTGEVIAVDRTVLIGRAPEARRFASHDQPAVVTVPSPQQEISSTHLEIRPGAGADHGSAIATDLGSTNGTVLAQPGLEPEELKPGIAVSLIPGAVIDLGDGVTIQVTNP